MPFRFDPKYWRICAEETRQLARGVRDEEANQIMLRIAADYEKLAERMGQEPCKATAHLMALYGANAGRTPLTRRQREVLSWIAAGKSAVQIGELLRISSRTVLEHSRSAARKLGAANRAQVIALAVHRGIIDLIDRDRPRLGP
jgi:DNA-binding CsgD family transcriptional regulator